MTEIPSDKNADFGTGLKPCPFCGAKATMWKDTVGWVARCTGDKAPCNAMQIANTEDDLIQIWNRRVYE